MVDHRRPICPRPLSLIMTSGSESNGRSLHHAPPTGCVPARRLLAGRPPEPSSCGSTAAASTYGLPAKLCSASNLRPTLHAYATRTTAVHVRPSPTPTVTLWLCESGNRLSTTRPTLTKRSTTIASRSMTFSSRSTTLKRQITRSFAKQSPLRSRRCWSLRRSPSRSRRRWSLRHWRSR
jgi:hypothetical protein